MRMKIPRFYVKRSLQEFLKDRKETIEQRIKICTRYLHDVQMKSNYNLDDVNKRKEIINTHEEEIKHIKKWLEAIHYTVIE